MAAEPNRPLDRSSPMPLWAQLESALRERLGAGEFDDRFPTDAELVEEYQVSRHTVREAIRHLNRTGVLRRERGRGTVVNRGEFEQPLGALYSLFQSVESSGTEQRSDVLALRVETNAMAAERLELPPDTELVFLERVRYADGVPLAIDRAWLPHDIAAPILGSDFSHTALYDVLESRCHLRPDEGWERIAPIIPPASDRDHLGIRRGEAAMFLERCSSAGGRKVEWRTTTIRGDRYRFVANWRQGTRPAMTAAAV